MEVLAKKGAKRDSTSFDPQVGQEIFPSSLSLIERVTPKVFLHCLHRNSYIGILLTPVLDDVTCPVRRPPAWRRSTGTYEASRCLRMRRFSRFIPIRASLSP